MSNLNTASVPMTYVELHVAVHQPTGDMVWEDWDLSASIPANAKYCEVIMKCTTGTQGIRAKSSADERKESYVYWTQVVFTTPLNAGRVISIYGTSANSYWWCTGYWI